MRKARAVALGVTVLFLAATGLSGCTPGASGNDGAPAATGTTASSGDATAPAGAGRGADRDGGTEPDGRDDEDGAGKPGDPADRPARDEPADAEAPVPADRAPSGAVPLDAEPVALGDDPARDDLTVGLTGIERTEAEASMPGEIAGSAIRVEVSVNNTGDANHDLGASVVNLYYGPDRTPAGPLSGSGEQALPAFVAAGEKVAGTYVFSVPEDGDGQVLVEIDVDPELHVALFKGEVE